MQHSSLFFSSISPIHTIQSSCVELVAHIGRIVNYALNGNSFIKTREIKACCVFAVVPRITSFLIRLVDGGVNLGTQVGRGGAGPEVSAESRGKERAENDLGATRIEFSPSISTSF